MDYPRAQVHLREMIAFASKKKKAVREELLQLRTMAADWKGGQEPDDPALFGKKVKTRYNTGAVWQKCGWAATRPRTHWLMHKPKNSST